MAKRKRPVNPLANIRPLETPATDSQTSEDKVVAPTTKTGYNNPLSNLAKESISKAVRQTSQAGKYKKRTFLIPPDMDELINEICKETSVRRMELGRWLLAKGIQAYQNGDGPQVEEVVSVRVKIPDYTD